MAADRRSTRLYDVGVMLNGGQHSSRTVSLSEPQVGQLGKFLEGKRQDGRIAGFSIFLAKPMGAASVYRWLQGLGIER